MSTPDVERFPLIDDAGWRNFLRLREHPHAPRFNHYTGNKLTANGLRQVRDYAAQLAAEPPRWLPNELPPWLPPFVHRCYADVPVYRRNGPAPARFSDIPPCARPDLSREPWAFVPDSEPVEDIIIYTTSGTTGHPMQILFHPAASAKYVPLLQSALSLFAVKMEGGPSAVSAALVCYQRTTFILASVTPYLDHAGFVKVNLNPADWRDPNDPARYLDALNPEVYTGDPVAFVELAKLPLTAKPKALISTAMHFTSGLRAALADHFACPVLDVYSMNETGPIAVLAPDEAGYLPLQSRLYIEILDDQGRVCEPGERGEITLTGGLSPYIPLLRYRTGDYAAMEYRGKLPVIIRLEGRPPVVFRGARGQFVNNIDISWVLRELPLSHFRLHQRADGHLICSVRGLLPDDAIRHPLLDVFGQDQQLTIEREPDGDVPPGKSVQYTSELGLFTGEPARVIPSVRSASI